MSELKESEIAALRRACKCLFIQVPEDIANDVRQKAEAVIALAANTRANTRTVPGEAEAGYCNHAGCTSLRMWMSDFCNRHQPPAVRAEGEDAESMRWKCIEAIQAVGTAEWEGSQFKRYFIHALESIPATAVEKEK